MKDRENHIVWFDQLGFVSSHLFVEAAADTVALNCGFADFFADDHRQTVLCTTAVFGKLERR